MMFTPQEIESLLAVLSIQTKNKGENSVVFRDLRPIQIKLENEMEQWIDYVKSLQQENDNDIRQ